MFERVRVCVCVCMCAREISLWKHHVMRDVAQEESSSSRLFSQGLLYIYISTHIYGWIIWLLRLTYMSLGCVYEDGLCVQLSQRSRLNRLNERDLSLDASASQSYIPGIDLNALVLDPYGYTMNSTSIIKDVLDAGLRRLYLDVYWDEIGKTWQLCPQPPPPPKSNGTYVNTTTVPVQTLATMPKTGSEAVDYKRHSTSTSFNDDSLLQRHEFAIKPEFGTLHGEADSGNFTTTFLRNNVQCDYAFDFQQFVLALRDYIDLSDTNVAASLLYLQLRPKIWQSKDRSYSTQSVGRQSSLNSTLSSELGGRILKPSDVRNTISREQRKKHASRPGSQNWPTMKTVLYSNTYRLIVSYNDSLSSEIPDLATLGTVAFPMQPTITNPLSYTVSELNMLNFTDTMVHNYQEWIEAKLAGVSPILGKGDIQVYDGSLIRLLDNYEFWAWAPQQPILYTEDQRKSMMSNGYNRNAKLAACAVFGESGMEVANCNSHFPVLCKSQYNSLEWILTDDKHSYFDPSCPKKHEFAAPSTPLESRVVREMHRNFFADPAWVDFNSLYFANCWVTGGTNAVCPYNIRQNGRNGIGYISVAAVVAFFALLFIILFEWDRGRSPLMRKHLKRNRDKNTEYEGVPS